MLQWRPARDRCWLWQCSDGAASPSVSSNSRADSRRSRESGRKNPNCLLLRSDVACMHGFKNQLASHLSLAPLIPFSLRSCRHRQISGSTISAFCPNNRLKHGPVTGHFFFFCLVGVSLNFLMAANAHALLQKLSPLPSFFKSLGICDQLLKVLNDFW